MCYNTLAIPNFKIYNMLEGILIALASIVITQGGKEIHKQRKDAEYVTAKIEKIQKREERRFTRVERRLERIAERATK